MANDENIIVTKSYSFSVDIVVLCRSIILKQKEYVITKQLIRSATSIGANVEEAQAASSKKDFLNKMTIALKEARETFYWLRILKDAKIIESEALSEFMKRSKEIIAILMSITKTVKEKL